MMPYPSLIPYVWYPIEVPPESRDAAMPSARNGGPDHARDEARAIARSNQVVRLAQLRLGVASQACSAALFRARVLVSRVRQTLGMARMRSVKMQRGRLKAVQCTGGAAAPITGNDQETVGTHAAHPIGHGH